MRAVRLKTDVADEIARKHGFKTYAERGAFYGVHETTYLRASRPPNGDGKRVTVGGEFIAAALSSRAAEVEPGFCFDTIFEVAS
jgi:hypothetical protein